MSRGKIYICLSSDLTDPVLDQSYAYVCTVLQLELSALAFFQAQDLSLYVVF